MEGAKVRIAPPVVARYTVPPLTRGRATVSGRMRVLSLAVSYPYAYMYLRSLNNAF